MTEAPASLAAALVQLQARLPRIGKSESAEVTTQQGRKYSYSYADLASIYAVALPLLAAVGLAWTCFPTLRDDGQFVLRYELLHAASGELKWGEWPLGQGGPQALGSAVTYAKRYSFCAVTGITPDEDDDGAAAEAEARKPKSRSEERTAAGLMTSAQSRAHDRLVTETRAQPKLADRSRGPLPDDEWTTPDPGQAAPSSKAQRNAIATLASRLGAVDDDDRHELIRQALDLPAPAGSQDITAADASKVIKWMQDRVNS